MIVNALAMAIATMGNEHTRGFCYVLSSKGQAGYKQPGTASFLITATSKPKAQTDKPTKPKHETQTQKGMKMKVSKMRYGQVQKAPKANKNKKQEARSKGAFKTQKPETRRACYVSSC